MDSILNPILCLEGSHLFTTKRILTAVLAVAILLTAGYAAFASKAPKTGSPALTAKAPDSPAAPAQKATPGDRASLIAQAASLPAPKGQIIRGSSTDVNQYMFAGPWQNSASNADLWRMISMDGYPVVVWTKNGTFEVNPIVTKEYETTENADGSKTYRFDIYEDLVWNDGTPITAKDYAFSLLLRISPQFKAIEASNVGGEVFAGGEAYTKGETKKFTGLRLLGDHSFSLTLAAKELPNHFEMADLNIFPLPTAVIAPGCEVKDDGDGAYMSDAFTADLIRETLLSETSGWAFFPKVTAGPYQFESYDSATKSAVLTANPTYLSTYDGYKPQIEKIIFKKVDSATMMDELSTGGVDLLDGASTGTEINKGLDLVDAGGFNKFNYPRNGFGYVTFKCDRGPTKFAAVRQAIAWLLDRNEFVNSYASGYATVVDSFYGAAQPEYIAKKDELEAKLTHYTLNPEKAVELLVEGGWTLNADGSEYDPAVGGVRHKDVDGTLMPLEIEWMASEANPIADLLTTMLLPEAEKVGMKINKTQVDFTTLLSNYNRDGIPDSPYTMFNLAVGFSEATAYWYNFSPEEKYANLWNSNNIIDEELASIATQMKSVPAEDTETWQDLWVNLMVRYNELMPDLPLYSNDYHDFYAAKLQGYEVNSMWNWARAIVRSSVSE